MKVKDLIKQLLERPMDEDVIIEGNAYINVEQDIIVRGPEQMGESLNTTYIIAKNPHEFA